MGDHWLGLDPGFLKHLPWQPANPAARWPCWAASIQNALAVLGVFEQDAIDEMQEAMRHDPGLAEKPYIGFDTMKTILQKVCSKIPGDYEYTATYAIPDTPNDLMPLLAKFWKSDDNHPCGPIKKPAPAALMAAPGTMVLITGVNTDLEQICGFDSDPQKGQFDHTWKIFIEEYMPQHATTVWLLGQK